MVVKMCVSDFARREMEMYQCFQQNVQAIRIKESSFYGIEYDERLNLLFAMSDFGHICIYDLSVLSQNPPSKTLYQSNPPAYCSYLFPNNSGNILLRLWT
jgi:hypothetical protein